eukprot:TRINITY_DN10185_c0_g1_i3.p1 TRINITY_DN10185_c0_g1~~TRINITY_DN10185_c0_g1_i3.p1  ORF type:complete len:371 (+),score=24.22 TRINITY_DN10185_c0_g1_i3:30-1115(+)
MARGRLILCLLLMTQAVNSKCPACESLLQKLSEGMRKTEKSNFGGGNSEWEAKSLGSWQKSETRLSEILDQACSSKDYTCHSLLEEGEEFLEDWWKSRDVKDDSDVESLLRSSFCVDQLKVCCAKGYYGKNCKACPGGADHPCNGAGDCQGSGRRDGSGKCKCNIGYKGKSCNKCKAGFYKDTETKACLSCDPACSNCTGPAATDCLQCADGYELLDGSCQDIDECQAVESKCSQPDQYCANEPGNFACRSCHANCLRGKGCKGPASAECNECAPGYERDSSGACEDVDECASGLKQCDVGTFCQNGAGWSECKPCHDSCGALGCSGSTAKHCNDCDEGYQFEDGNGCQPQETDRQTKDEL